MVGRRKTASPLPPRLYVYKGKRQDTYYTITATNERMNLGHDLLTAKRKLLELEEGVVGAHARGQLQVDDRAGERLGVLADPAIGELLDDYLKEV